MKCNKNMVWYEKNNDIVSLFYEADEEISYYVDVPYQSIRTKLKKSLSELNVCDMFKFPNDLKQFVNGELIEEDFESCQVSDSSNE